YLNFFTAYITIIRKIITQLFLFRLYYNTKTYNDDALECSISITNDVSHGCLFFSSYKKKQHKTNRMDTIIAAIKIVLPVVEEKLLGCCVEIGAFVGDEVGDEVGGGNETGGDAGDVDGDVIVTFEFEGSYIIDQLYSSLLVTLSNRISLSFSRT